MASLGSPWGVLVAAFTLTWAVCFIQNLPSVLSTPLQLYLGLPESQYAYLISALYTVYSAPNIILPFFAGPLMQRCGERGALLLTLTSIALGQTVVVFSIQMRMQWGMIAGRLLFGLGGEIIAVLVYEIITRWFRKNLSTILAIMLSSSQMGIVTASMTIQRLSEAYGIVAVSWISSGIALTAAFLSICYLACVDRGKALDTEEGDDDEEPASGDSNSNCLSILASYPYAFWLLGMMCVLVYGSINTFSNSAQRFLASVFYAGNQVTAGQAMSLMYIVSSILTLPMGYILDLPIVNRPSAVLLFASLLLLLSHTLFLTTPSPMLPLSILGLASTIFGISFWKNLTDCLLSMAKPVPSRKVLTRNREYGTIATPPANNAYTQEIITLGFGCMTCVMNLASATVPVLLAMAESAAGYQGLEMVFWVLGVLGCFVAGHLVCIEW